MLDIIEKEDVDILDSYQGKWKNLHFSKCGDSGLSGRSYDSEKSALERLLSCLSKESPYNCFTTIEGKQFVYRDNVSGTVKRWSHTIQIPIGGDSE